MSPSINQMFFKVCKLAADFRDKNGRKMVGIDARIPTVIGLEEVMVTLSVGQ
jgi:hypothetical protein